MCQLAKQYVSIPKIVAFEHLWPFLRKRPQRHRKQCFVPKAPIFHFTYVTFNMHIIECYLSRPKIVPFEATWIVRELLLFLTFPYTRNAISSFLYLFSEVLAKKYDCWWEWYESDSNFPPKNIALKWYNILIFKNDTSHYCLYELEHYNKPNCGE